MHKWIGWQLNSLQCRRFLRAREFFCSLKLPKRGGNGASQRERGGGGEREKRRRRRVFFLPSSLSFFRPRTYPKGYYFYSPRSSSVIKSKMAVTTIFFTFNFIILHLPHRLNITKRKWNITPSAVHYEKIRVHLRETATISKFKSQFKRSFTDVIAGRFNTSFELALTGRLEKRENQENQVTFLIFRINWIRIKVAQHCFASLWVYVICQIMARGRLQLTSWNLASEKCTDERFWLTGKIWRFRSFHGNMNDWIQP